MPGAVSTFVWNASVSHGDVVYRTFWSLFISTRKVPMRLQLVAISMSIERAALSLSNSECWQGLVIKCLCLEPKVLKKADHILICETRHPPGTAAMPMPAMQPFISVLTSSFSNSNRSTIAWASQPSTKMSNSSRARMKSCRPRLSLPSLMYFV